MSEVAATPDGVIPVEAGKPGEVVFKVEGANVITSMTVPADVFTKTEADVARILIAPAAATKGGPVCRSLEVGQARRAARRGSTRRAGQRRVWDPRESGIGRQGRRGRRAV